MRSSRTYVTFSGTSSVVDQCDSSNNGSYNPTRTVTGFSNRTKGTRVPGWKYLTSHGKPASSDLSGLSTEIVARVDPPSVLLIRECVSGSQKRIITDRASGWVFADNFDFLYNGSLSDSAMTKARNKALTRFNSKAMDYITPFQGGVFIAELKKTAELLRNPVRALRDLFSRHLGRTSSAMKRYHNRPGFEKNVLKVAAESWLEVQYGWRPTVGDVRNASKAMHSLSFTRAHVVGFGQEHVLSYNDFGQIGLQGKLTVSANQDVDFLYDSRIRGAVGLNSGFAALPSRLGVDLPSFIPTLYELIPYSFVLDYFSNMQEYLTSLCSPVAASVLWWNRSDVLDRSIIFRNGISTTTRGRSYSGDAKGFIVGRARTFSRTGGSGSTFPSFTLAFGSELNWEKIINLAALLETSRLTSSRLRR